MLKFIKNIINKKPTIDSLKLNINFRLFNDDIWDGDLDSLSEKKIYCYQEPRGGIYKTMTLSTIGNEDYDSRLGPNKYFAFVRIDNTCGYCQFSYRSLKKLFESHLSSLHKNYTIYEFLNQSEFFEWCMTRPIQYKYRTLDNIKN